MSDDVIIAAITAFCSLATVSISGYMAFLMAKLNQKQASAAIEVSEVKEKAAEAADAAREVKFTLETTTTAVDKKLVEIQKLGVDTHTLVNSNMGIQLQAVAAALRRIALMTKEQSDINLADKADARLKLHEKQQAIVDGKKE